MSRNRIIQLLLLFIFALFLISCGGSAPTQDADSAAEEPAPAVEEEMAEEAMEEEEAMADEGDGLVGAVGSEDEDGSPFEPADGPKVESTRVASTGWIDESGVSGVRAGEGGGEAAELAVAAPAMAVDDAIAVEVAVDAEMAEADVVMEESAAVSRSVEGEPVAIDAATGELDQNSQLSAGDVDDNAQWDDYLLYRREYAGPAVIDVDISERHQIFVTNQFEQPILEAVLRINANGEQVAQLRTHSDGRAYFFPKALPEQLQADEYQISIEVGGETAELVIPAGSGQREWFVNIDDTARAEVPVRLDVLFLIDATGSMADEIQQLKDNVLAVSARIDALPSRPDVRYAMTVYRDREDAYTTRTFEFTPDVEFFSQGLAEVEAFGGGDYPEDLNEAIFKAIHVPEWRVEQTVSLIFLIADAPPHLDYADQETNYAIEMQEAARRGIKIYPIASSGLDEQGEYIFRQLAQYTGGRFLFLTYGAGGAGTTGSETSMSVDEFDVTSLDGLIIKIVEEELALRVAE